MVSLMNVVTKFLYFAPGHKDKYYVLEVNKYNEKRNLEDKDSGSDAGCLKSPLDAQFGEP